MPEQAPAFNFPAESRRRFCADHKLEVGDPLSYDGFAHWRNLGCPYMAASSTALSCMSSRHGVIIPVMTAAWQHPCQGMVNLRKKRPRSEAESGGNGNGGDDGAYLGQGGEQQAAAAYGYAAADLFALGSLCVALPCALPEPPHAWLPPHVLLWLFRDSMHRGRWYVPHIVCVDERTSAHV